MGSGALEELLEKVPGLESEEPIHDSQEQDRQRLPGIDLSIEQDELALRRHEEPPDDLKEDRREERRSCGPGPIAKGTAAMHPGRQTSEGDSQHQREQEVQDARLEPQFHVEVG